ncbi:polymorphic toxin-type HINT domain-containing protein [Promicromonospora vindobonensis]|uniref:Polymorphic toxin-type HINT domain-containing protein n=1 Tax=Promicromonospora vindobonensis TaxID=195748 RepID=A0ABW5VT29_9MICO
MLVLSGGQEYLEVAESIDSAASSMSRLDVDGTISQAVDALMATKEDTIGEVRKAHGRYVAAGEALVGYASSLERVQSETLAALDKARDAQDQVQAASGSKDRWQDLADSAKDETEKREYEQKAEQAGGDADQAAGIISSAKSTVESAVSDRDRAAEHAIDRIEEITSSDDLNDGWWDNWGSKLVAAIADIADMISTIAGILAIIVAFIPVVGTALAGVLIVIAAVAAIVSAVANITLAATGERSWAEAGLAIAGAALSLIGLGAAAKAATGLAKGISKTAVKQGVRSGKNCKLGFGACFVAGTPVLTADGTKPIEDITVGDKVWTRNLTTGLDELQLVAETFVHQTVVLHHLTINGSVLSTTAEHPFMVQDKGWQMAGNLHPGDVLITPDGTTVLEAVEVEQRDLADIENVYNFHVENNLNYYVHAGDTPVLVHNAHAPKPPDLVTARSGEVIDRAKINTRISRQKQDRHVEDSPIYRHGGYFKAENVGDAQKVLDEFHNGTAAVIGLKNPGPDAFIAVESPNITAFNHNPRAGFPNQPTNTFFIKGSASPSVVPTTPGWTP